MEWPGLTFQLRSDSESEADDLLHDNEIAPNIIISGQMGGIIQTIDVTNAANEQKAVEKKHQLTMESFAQLAPRSKLGDQRKIRKLGDDKRRHPVSNVDDSDVKLAAPVSRSNAPPVGKKNIQSA